MRRTSVSFGIVCALTLLAQGAVAEQNDKNAAKVAPTTDKSVDRTADILDHFNKASAKFAARDNTGSAQELRAASSAVLDSAQHPSATARDLVVAAVRELDKLAGSVGSSKVFAARTLDDAFARTHYALGRDQYGRFQTYWFQKDFPAAAASLRSSAVHVEAGYERSGQKLKEDGEEDITEAFELASRIARGAEPPSNEVWKTVGALSKRLEGLRTRIGSPQPPVVRGKK